MAGLSPFAAMTNILPLNLLNSVKTFRENSNVSSGTMKKGFNGIISIKDVQCFCYHRDSEKKIKFKMETDFFSNIKLQH